MSNTQTQSRVKITSDTIARKLVFTGSDRDYSAGDSLYLRVRKASKVWIYKTAKGGKVRIKTLGKFGDLKYKEAKNKVLKLDKADLVDDSLFSLFLNKYYKERVLSGSRKHKRPEQAKRYLDILSAEFGTKRVSDITKRQLVKFIQEYAKRGERAADQLRSHAKNVFSYALQLGYIELSPMDGVTSDVTGYVAKPRERVLNDDEIRFIFNLSHPNARLIRFLLLTGLRISEAQEGHLDADIWRVTDSKNGKAHWVHLSDLAKEQLPLPETGKTAIQAWLKRRLIKQGYEDADRFTPHDCRRTFATRLNDKGIEPYIVEKCLNHSLEGVMAVYNHAEYVEQRIEAGNKIADIYKEVLEGKK
ncbi:tyrosine-type recombinase/integrase [Methylophaga sp.]|uniref:tyrosine-type recombinase/integrase n=1 Tax=Methylophaga sp. TaxID=2024840 RepID=UPI0014012410|nr:tyrosine-type recombinase/integrase [Methylophaga sp.]MTI64393.1 hypothetical protein [Methylophaga sp.]